MLRCIRFVCCACFDYEILGLRTVGILDHPSTVLPWSLCSPGMEALMGLFFMTEAMASCIYKEIQFVWFNLVFNVHFSLVVLCSTTIMEQEVTIHSLSDINPWTTLKTSSHLTGKCKSYKPVWWTTCYSFLTVSSTIPQIKIGWISMTKKSADSNWMSAFYSAACMRRKIGNKRTSTIFSCHLLFYRIVFHIYFYLIPL